MKIKVDHSLCEGHAKCMETVPEVFELHDDDRSYVKMSDVPEAFRARVERAVRICPRQALSISD